MSVKCALLLLFGSIRVCKTGPEKSSELFCFWQGLGVLVWVFPGPCVSICETLLFCCPAFVKLSQSDSCQRASLDFTLGVRSLANFSILSEWAFAAKYVSASCYQLLIINSATAPCWCLFATVLFWPWLLTRRLYWSGVWVWLDFKNFIQIALMRIARDSADVSWVSELVIKTITNNVNKCIHAIALN